MAEFSSVLSQDQITCPICLDPLTSPVTIPCGHTYCLECIKRCWDEDQKGIYRCPQCRQIFSERPALNKNTMFADVVEKLRETGLQPAPAEHAYPGLEDTSCDVCTGRKLKATQSCLTCLASYCELHFSLHNELNAGNKHRVISATTKLQESICTAHNKLLEVYCNTDCQFICYLCAMSTHKEHETLSVAGSSDKQRLLGVAQMKSLEKVQRKEREAQDLRKGIDSFKKSAQTCVADCERAFRKLIECAEESCSEVTGLIRDQEEAEVHRAAGLLESLEKESSEMKQRAAQLRKLEEHTNDHIYFIQHFQPLCSPTESEEVAFSVIRDTCCNIENLRKSISDLQKQLQELCKQETERLSESVDEESGGRDKRKLPPRKDDGERESGPCHSDLEWRRQKSEERVPTHQTPLEAWRRRRASSEEPARPDPAQTPPIWRRQGHERRPREGTACDLDWRRSNTRDSKNWRSQPHRGERQ